MILPRAPLPQAWSISMPHPNYLPEVLTAKELPQKAVQEDD